MPSVRSFLGEKLKRFERQFEPYNRITVSRSAILHNFDLFGRITQGKMVFPVLKSNAYGHGLKEVATILKARTFPYIAVDGHFEALQIRTFSKQPVLVMGAIKPTNFKKMKFSGLAFVVSRPETVKALGQTRKKVKVHIELETGMGRYGVAMHDLNDFLALVKTYPNIEVEGVMSHLADSDNPTSRAYVDLQTQLFDEGVEKMKAAGFSPKYFHLAQSAGSVKAHSRYANAVRIGIGLYGINSLDPADANFGVLSALQPALTLTSTITDVHALQPGETVSYGRTFKAMRKSRIAVLPLGYYEGVSRTLSNTGIVQFAGAYLPIVGKVNMNHTMVDATDSQAQVGDAVELISTNPESKTSLAALCAAYKIFPWEALVRLSPNIRRTLAK